jgi:hypothetical protein
MDQDTDLSDAFIRFLIAHELAHVILRHPQMCTGHPAYNNIRDAMWRTFEDHANRQVWLWGFIDELKAQHQLHPELSPLWYDGLMPPRTLEEINWEYKQALEQFLEEERRSLSGK